MNDKTKQCIALIMELASVTEFNALVRVSKNNNTFSGILIKFDPELDLEKFPSIKCALENQKLKEPK